MPAQALLRGQTVCRHGSAWEVLAVVEVAVQTQADLLEVILALHTCSGFAHLSNGRDNQRDDNSNQGQHDQDIDKASHGWTDNFLLR